MNCTEDSGIASLLLPDLIRTPDRGIAGALCKRSHGLERLFASYIVDANDFFDLQEPNWVWHGLTSLALTSRLLTSTGDTSDINLMLMQAGKAALRMPKLQVMEIWNGTKGNACVFRFETTWAHATIGWCGTWDLTMYPRLINTWKAVAQRNTKHQLSILASQVLDPLDIKSHAVAIRKLGLQEGVVHPVSLEQIRREARGDTHIPNTF